MFYLYNLSPLDETFCHDVCLFTYVENILDVCFAAIQTRAIICDVYFSEALSHVLSKYMQCNVDLAHLNSFTQRSLLSNKQLLCAF